MAGLYTLATILLVFPLVDLFAATWPFDFGDLAWRHAALGLAASYLHTPILGFALGLGIAHWRGHGRALRVAGYLGTTAAGLLLPFMVVFALDTLSVRELRPPEMRSDTLVAGMIQVLKYFAAAAAAGMLGLGSVQMASMRRAAHRPAEARSPGALRGAGG